MIRACAFDLGNTLSNDTLLAEQSIRAMGAWLEAGSHVASADDFVRTYGEINYGTSKPFISHTYGEEEFFARSFERLGISDLSPDAALERYRRIVTENTVIGREIADSLRLLARKGIRLAILSNERITRVEAWLERTELGALFDAVTVSEEVGAEKPDPGIFRETSRRLGIPAGQIAMFGDNSIADGACREIGMLFVLVTAFRTRQWYFEKGSEHRPDYTMERITPESMERFLRTVNGPAGA